MPSASEIGSRERHNTACNRFRGSVEVLRMVPVRRIVPSRLGKAGDIESMLIDTHDSGSAAEAVGLGSQAAHSTPLKRVVAANRTRTVHVADPLLTGSSYSPAAFAPAFFPRCRSAAPLQWANVSRSDRLSQRRPTRRELVGWRRVDLLAGSGRGLGCSGRRQRTRRLAGSPGQRLDSHRRPAGPGGVCCAVDAAV